MGELIAWMIAGRVLEYCVGAATVSIGWSQTLIALLHNFGIDFPAKFIASPFQPITLTDGTVVHGIINVPAVLVVVIVSVILILGIRESAGVNTRSVFLKVSVVVVFIALGWKFINPANHTPFIPPNTGLFGEFGWSGIVSGAGVIFLHISDLTPSRLRRRKPSGRNGTCLSESLVRCSFARCFSSRNYVLTGVVNYKELNVAAPLSIALTRIPIPWLSTAMNLAVLAGLTSVMLVMLLGQSRVFYTMSRDGLLPPLFSSVHPKFRTPWRCNLVLMLFVGLFAAFAPISVVGKMTSIGRSSPS